MFVENSQQPAVHPVETDRPADLTICYWGVSTIYPVCNVSPTSLSWLTWKCHSYACWALKTKPSRSDSTVTITVVRSILFHNTQLLALIVIKIWENWSSALEEAETVIDSRSKHEFLAKKGLGRVGRSTFLLGADYIETERRGSVQRHLLLPIGIQGPVHLHTLMHETCYCNILASRFDFEYCE